MLKTFFRLSIACGLLLIVTQSCLIQEFKKDNNKGKSFLVDQLSPEMKKVRDYVPKYAVIAHRGSTFFAPEETEAAYRWAREIGADYLEADLQISKDGVIMALHDDNLKRTSNIEDVFGEDVPKVREAYYLKLGYSAEEAKEMYEADKASFVPYLTSFYTYEELLMLDAGTWFNQANIGQARIGFSTQKQYASSLEDLVAYARGKKLKRDADGNRFYKLVGKTGDKVVTLSGSSDVVKYEFEYEDDDEGDSGHKPGIYLEFKEPWLNPIDFEKRVLNELDRLDMNVITKPEPTDASFYKDGKVNVVNTNGKVILQTFSLSSLIRVSEITKGKIPMCFLLWKGSGAPEVTFDTPQGYASFINQGIIHKAHIIGPCIAGAPNNYPELNKPWQSCLIKKSGMLNHPYSFDTYEQMEEYMGDSNFGEVSKNMFEPPYFDGVFTNRSEMTIQYFIDKGVRGKGAPTNVPDSDALLTKLGYPK